MRPFLALCLVAACGGGDDGGPDASTGEDAGPTPEAPLRPGRYDVTAGALDTNTCELPSLDRMVPGPVRVTWAAEDPLVFHEILHGQDDVISIGGSTDDGGFATSWPNDLDFRPVHDCFLTVRASIEGREDPAGEASVVIRYDFSTVLLIQGPSAGCAAASLEAWGFTFGLGTDGDECSVVANATLARQL